MSKDFDHLMTTRNLEFELHEECRSFVHGLKIACIEKKRIEAAMPSKPSITESAQLLARVFPEKDGLWILQFLEKLDAEAFHALRDRIESYERTKAVRIQLEEALISGDFKSPEQLANRVVLLSSLALDGRVIEWESWLNDLLENAILLLNFLKTTKLNSAAN